MSAITPPPPAIDTSADFALRRAALPGSNGLTSAEGGAASLDWLGALPPSEETIPGEPSSGATPDVNRIVADVLARLGG